MVDANEAGRDRTQRSSARERLEQQAAQILGKARADAAEVLRFARSEAEGILRRAKEHAEVVEGEAGEMREEARRELARAQQRALAIRSEAQRVADGIIRRATQQARIEADSLLRDARLQLARAVEEMNQLQAAAQEISEDAVVIDLRSSEPVLDLTSRATPVPLAAVGRPAPDKPGPVAAPPAQTASPMRTDELREWVSDLSDENLDALIASAVECAVQRAINPTVVRAGRYTMLRRAV